MRRMVIVVLAAAFAAAAVPVGAPAAGPTTVWTRIPAPGMPEGLAVRDGTVYVSTHTSVRGNAGEGPSRIFAYDLATRELTGTIEITGQRTSATHGLLAMAFDAQGRLYVVDRNPGRIVRIDLVSGVQHEYARIPDLPACRPTGPTTSCAPVTVDEPTFADYFAFTADGSAYVTDLQAATIFRVPPGGGDAEIWYQDPRFDSIFGLNGIAVDPSGTKLYFAMTGSLQPGTPTQGIIYTLPIVASPTPADLGVFHVYPEPAAGPDGIAFGASGKLYVALAGANQISILGASGSEIERFPDAVANNTQQEVPYDLPASIAFDGAGSLLVTNQSFFAANPDNWAVLAAPVGDTALAVPEPSLP